MVCRKTGRPLVSILAAEEGRQVIIPFVKIAFWHFLDFRLHRHCVRRGCYRFLVQCDLQAYFLATPEYLNNGQIARLKVSQCPGQIIYILNRNATHICDNVFRLDSGALRCMPLLYRLDAVLKPIVRGGEYLDPEAAAAAAAAVANQGR